MSKWHTVIKDRNYMNEFLDMFWSFHDFRIKRVSFDCEAGTVDLVLEYDVPKEVNDVLLRFSDVRNININTDIDYEADWLFGSELFLTDSNNLLWCATDEIHTEEEIKRCPGITWVEAAEINFGFVDSENRLLDFPEDMLHQTWHILNLETKEYEDIKKDFRVFAATTPFE